MSESSTTTTTTSIKGKELLIDAGMSVVAPALVKNYTGSGLAALGCVAATTVLMPELMLPTTLRKLGVPHPTYDHSTNSITIWDPETGPESDHLYWWEEQTSTEVV